MKSLRAVEKLSARKHGVYRGDCGESVEGVGVIVIVIEAPAGAFIGDEFSCDFLYYHQNIYFKNKYL